MSSWLIRAKLNLFNKSVEKENFQIARQEWLYNGLEDNQDCQAECELCNHEEIRYEYTIVNKFNKNQMIVGSECIKKFTDDFKHDFFDTDGNLVNATRLTKDKQEYFKKILDKIIDKKLLTSKNPFFISIGLQLKRDGKLSPNQLKCLKDLYNELEETEKKAFKNIVKVNLRKNNNKHQMSRLSNVDLKFINLFLSPKQRETFKL